MSTKNAELKTTTNQKIRFTPNVKHNYYTPGVTVLHTDKNSKQNNFKNLIEKEKSKVSLILIFN
jgi:hypothetical protein